MAGLLVQVLSLGRLSEDLDSDQRWKLWHIHPEIDFHKESAAMAPKRREESTLSKLATKL
jgi:hypothetical protein